MINLLAAFVNLTLAEALRLNYFLKNVPFNIIVNSGSFLFKMDTFAKTGIQSRIMFRVD